MERDSFVFRKVWYEALKDLDAETKAQAFDAICQFAIYHKVEENASPILKMAMAFIMPDLEEDCKRWIEIKEKRSEAGKLGGAPKGNKNALKQAKQANDCENKQNQAEQAKQAVYVSSLLLKDKSFFVNNICAGAQEKKEELLMKIGKEMLRKGATRPNKEAESFISYNDSQGWLLKNGRSISDPVAWAKNWKVENPSKEIINSAEAYILLLEASGISDRKMLDSLKGIAVDGNSITLKLSSKKTAEAFSLAEEDHLNKMRLALQLAFPEIKNPKLTYNIQR